MQRYFDGSEWTDHYAPAASPQVAGVVMTGETNHWIHLALTLFTCGLWIPIWVIAELSSSKRPMAVDIYGNPIQQPSQAAAPAPATRPAWLDKFPWLDKLPGDPMFWVFMGAALSAVTVFLLVALVIGR